MRWLGIGLFAVVVQLCAGASAAAQTAAHSASSNDDRHLRLFAQVGYAPQDDSDAGSYGVALGLKASYALRGWIHVGLEGTFHVGTQFGDELNRINYYGVEFGPRANYERVGFVPYLTSGIASVSTQRNVEPTVTSWYIGLGLALDVIVCDWLLVGAEARIIEISSAVQQGDNQGGSIGGDALLMIGVRL